MPFCAGLLLVSFYGTVFHIFLVVLTTDEILHYISQAPVGTTELVWLRTTNTEINGQYNPPGHTKESK